MDTAFYSASTLTPEEAERFDQVHGALTEATRALCDAQLRTTVGPEPTPRGVCPPRVDAGLLHGGADHSSGVLRSGLRAPG